MGCVQTKKSSVNNSKLSVLEERRLMYISYQTGKTYCDTCGNEFKVVKEGGRLQKVPVLKKLEKNPLYLKRISSQSDIGSQTRSLQ